MHSRQFILRTPTIRDHVAAYIGKLGLETLAEVIVRPFVDKRMVDQNARLWALHARAAQYTGHSAEEMHEFALMRFFGTKEIKVGEMVRQVPLKRSSQRNKKEFGEFMESTEAWYIEDFGAWLDQRDAA